MGSDLAYTGVAPGVHAMYRPTVKVMKAPAEPCCGRRERLYLWSIYIFNYHIYP